MNERRKFLTAGWLGAAGLTFFSAFVLPFFFPLSIPVLSQTYTAGADNRVAIVALAVISTVVTAFCWWLRLSNPDRSQEPAAAARGLRRRYLAGMCVVAAVFTAILGFFFVRQGEFYSDAGYFLTQLRTGIVFDGRIYRDFEFAYGPALYYWPATFVRVLARVGVSMMTSYVVSLLVLLEFGLGLLFYTVQALPVRRELKVWAFLLLAFGALNPLLGLNYCVFRFILPLAAVVLLTRQTTILRAVLVAAGAQLVQCTVSPEIAIAFGGAAITYGAYRCLVSSRGWLWVSAGSVLGAGLFLVIAPPGYMQTMGKFASGGFNLIIEPSPHVYGLLVALVAIAPLAVAGEIRRTRSGVLDTPSPQPAAAGLVIGMYVVALGMLPAALSRGDPLHTFFNGLGEFLLCFVAFEHAPLRWRKVGIAGVALVVAYTQLQDFNFYRPALVSMVHKTLDQDDSPYLPGLEEAIGHEKVAFPWEAPVMLIDRLTATGQYQPGYFCVMTLDRASELRKVAEMRAVNLVMVPRERLLAWNVPIDNSGFRARLRLGYQYKVRRAPYYTGSLMLSELRANWRPVGNFGKYALYRKVR